LPIEGKKALTYNSVSGTRRPASQGAQKPSIPHCARQLEKLTPTSKSEDVRFHTEGRKTVTCYCVGGTRRPDSRRCTEAQHFNLCLPEGQSCLSCLTAESQLLHWMAICYKACLSQWTETQYTPLWLQESPHTPIKEQELQIPSWGKRKGNRHHNKNLASGNITSIPHSEKNCCNFRRTKLKSQTTGAQGLKP
jgi:hypothetical protein